MHLVVQHECKSTGDVRIYSLEDAIIEGDHIVGNCFGTVMRVLASTITKAIDQTTGEFVEISNLIKNGQISIQ